MKINKFILALFAISTILFSCKKEPYKDYEGNWSGTYAGDDTGSWNINIDEDGKVSGTAVSDSIPFFTMSGSGQISKSGDLSTTVSFFGTTIEFSGKASGNTMSGTWSYVGENFSGTWTGKRN